MLSPQDYSFITDKLASAQQQNYNSIEKLEDAKERIEDVPSKIGQSVAERFRDQINEVVAYITNYEINNNQFVIALTKALQKHVATHWS
jgi:hypothetical protein